jgi:hypothetical protein
MDKQEKKSIQATPPSPRAPAVLAQREASVLELAAFNAEIAECALPAIEGQPGGKEALTALHDKIRAATFEIDCNAAAHSLAVRLDREAVAGWRADIDAAPAELAVAGITKKACCRMCNSDHGCVITAGAECAHPVLTGVMNPRHQDNPAIKERHKAAAQKLGVYR